MNSGQWSIGYDVGGTSARGALFERAASGKLTLIDSHKISIRDDTSPEGVITTMHQIASHLLSSHHLGLEHISAFGCGVAAQMDPTHTIALNAPNLGWRDVPISALAKDVFGREVYFFNDLNVLLWGEFEAGAARGSRDVLAVAIGTGVGGALVIDGKLAVGARGQAGEIGHIKVAFGEHSRVCGCGERGCIEAYAGGIHLEQRVADVIADQPWAHEVLSPQGKVDLTRADAHDSPVLQALFFDTAVMLAQVIANACTLLNPGKVIFGGGVFAHCPRFRHTLLEQIKPLVLAVSREHLELSACLLGEQAALLGSAALGLKMSEEELIHAGRS